MRDTLKAIGAVLSFYALVVGLAMGLGAVTPSAWLARLGDVLAPSAMLVPAAIAVNWLFVKRGWADWQRLGWPRWRTGVRGFGAGLAVGGAMAVGAIVLAVGLGGSRIVLTSEAVPAYLLAAVKLGFVLLVAALAEELLFRGYPLARMAGAVGKRWASVGLAGMFALAHVTNPNLTSLGLANIALAALVLSAAFFTAGALPAAWGLHAGWNGGLVLAADAPVSGIDFEVPILEFVTGEPSWFTGGTFGPEGGLVATTVMLLALGGLLGVSVQRKEVGGQ